jgi:tRNA modification GTPase
LKQELIKRVMPEGDSQTFGHAGPQVASQRQKSLIEDALKELEGIDPGQPSELIAASLDEVCFRLGEITGEIQGEEILDRIFSQFCVGK